jgi:hypothetical protein
VRGGTGRAHGCPALVGRGVRFGGRVGGRDRGVAAGDRRGVGRPTEGADGAAVVKAPASGGDEASVVTGPASRGDEPSVVNRPAAGGDQARSTNAAATSGPYRPPRRLATRVRARDRRCRFPGCSVAAVFCDVDHVRAWPGGPTALTNLVCLCRRHHRVKQRPGWAVRLSADGTVSWTDPTGRTRTTSPVDALSTVVLPGAADESRLPTPTSRARTDLPDGPHSAWEFVLEHLVTGPRPPPAWRDELGRQHRVEHVAVRSSVLAGDPDAWPHRPRRLRRWRCRDGDPPPF